jgi:transcriptional regulator with XRE-family HTH domain
MGHTETSIFERPHKFRGMNTISMNIRKLRKAHGLTQVELARKLQATQKVVTSYETNKRTPTLEKLRKLSQVFEVSIDEIVGKQELVTEEERPHLHGNSRTAKVQQLFDKLPPLEQRSILKQIKALVATNGSGE